MIQNLPPVSLMLRTAGLCPKKSMGQNFLFDLNITRKIARAVPDLDKFPVVEVGAGPGGLTRALLEMGAKKVIAIEKDKSALPILEEIKKASGRRLEIIQGDALKTPLPRAPISICANLPYNIGTKLLTDWLREENIKSMTLMFQKEVAMRIAAKPGTKQYGRLSVLAALGWRAKILFDVPNTAFCPPPKVQSAVVQIIKTPFDGDMKEIEKLTAMLFGQRRKMIRGILPNVDWGRFGLVGTERAEQLIPEMFEKLARELSAA